MTLRDDLVAAKALIDTAEKWRAGRTITEVLNEAIQGDDAFIAARAHLRRIHGDLLIGGRLERHTDVVALFDRAIAAAEASQ
jgi:hypothetical protein